MSKKSNITHQYKKALQRQCKYGESKHEAKELKKEEAKKNKAKIEQVRGIYSTATYNSYAKVCKQFVETVLKAHKEVRTFSDCHQYVNEFLENKQKKGVSSWTLHLYGSALGSAYDCSKNDFGFEFPERSRKDIKRCRAEHSSDYQYPQERWDTMSRLVLCQEKVQIKSGNFQAIN